MGFLPIFFLAFYLLIYLAIATAGYSFCHGMNKYKRRGRVVFLVILAFGACSLAGCAAAVLLTVILIRLNVHFPNEVFDLYLIIAYILSGTAGSWLFVWRVRKFAQWNNRHSADGETVTQD